MLYKYIALQKIRLTTVQYATTFLSAYFSGAAKNAALVIDPGIMPTFISSSLRESKVTILLSVLAMTSATETVMSATLNLPTPRSRRWLEVVLVQ